MNGRKIEYVLDDSGTILAEKYDTFTVRYLFNETGTRIGFAFTTGTGSSPYYYVFNGQGDVIGLRSASGTVVAKYAYDAWGKLLSVTDANGNAIPESSWSHAAYLNSFRYRNYYYDAESGLYFLNTRSYDPVTGRFINADGVLGANDDMSAYNLFAYCGNNPVNRFDIDGRSWDDICNFFDGVKNKVVDIGTAVVDAVTDTAEKVAHCFTESIDVHVEMGFGVGVDANVGVLDVDAKASVGGVYGINQDGFYDDIQGSVEIEGSVGIVGATAEIGAQGPTNSVLHSDEGLICNPLLDNEAKIGVTFLGAFFGATSNDKSTNKDFVLSWGFGAYFIVGGGGEVSINLNKFFKAWND